MDRIRPGGLPATLIVALITGLASGEGVEAMAQGTFLTYRSSGWLTAPPHCMALTAWLYHGRHVPLAEQREATEGTRAGRRRCHEDLSPAADRYGLARAGGPGRPPATSPACRGDRSCTRTSTTSSCSKKVARKGIAVVDPATRAPDRSGRRLRYILHRGGDHPGAQRGLHPRRASERPVPLPAARSSRRGPLARQAVILSVLVAGAGAGHPAVHRGSGRPHRAGRRPASAGDPGRHDGA